jgi:tricorn protease
MRRQAACWHRKHYGGRCLGPPRRPAPLAVPGIDVQPGDLLLAVNGQRLCRRWRPASLLVNQAEREILLTLAPRLVPEASSESAPRTLPAADTRSKRAGSPSPAAELRSVVVKAVQSDDGTRYRAWVEKNRQRVHAATEGADRLCYTSQTSGQRGSAELHRGFLF